MLLAREFHILLDKKFISDARLNYLAQILNIFLGFIFVTQVVKFAGLEVYGMLAVLLALGATVTNLISFRTNEALVKFYRRAIARKNDELKYFAILAGLVVDAITGLALLVIIQFFAETIEVKLLKTHEAQHAVVLFSYISAIQFLRGTGYGLLTAQERFKVINLLSVVEQATKVVCLVLAVWVSHQLILKTILLTTLVSSIPFTLFYLFIALRLLFNRPLRRWMRAKWIRLYWNFSASTFVSSTLKSGHKNLDAVILGYFSSPATVGVYNLFKQFISPVEMLASPYANQIYPKFVDALIRKSIEPVKLAIQQGSRTLLLQGCTIMLGVLPIAYVYFEWNNIKIAASDYLAFFVLIVASLMVQRLWWTRALSLATNPRLSITANSIALVITILVMPVLVSHLGGVLGAASSILVINAFLYYFWGKELVKVDKNVYKIT